MFASQVSIMGSSGEIQLESLCEQTKYTFKWSY